MFALLLNLFQIVCSYHLIRDFMNKKHLIIIALIIIVFGFFAFDQLKEEVYLDVWAEKIPDTSEMYFICELHNSKGEIIDTSLGHLDYEVLDANGSGIGSEGAMFFHGKMITRVDGEWENVHVRYDGGYIFRPYEYSGSLTVKNSTNLTDDDII